MKRRRGAGFKALAAGWGCLCPGVTYIPRCPKHEHCQAVPPPLGLTCQACQSHRSGQSVTWFLLQRDIRVFLKGLPLQMGGCWPRKAPLEGSHASLSPPQERVPRISCWIYLVGYRFASKTGSHPATALFPTQLRRVLLDSPAMLLRPHCQLPLLPPAQTSTWGCFLSPSLHDSSTSLLRGPNTRTRPVDQA